MSKKLVKVIIIIIFIFIAFNFIPIVPSVTSYSNEIQIIRDDYGVPHIFADTKEGLAFGCGYAMAQDRLWQADLYRKQAFGNLAEFGLASIDSDYYTRSLLYSREELGEIFDNWEPKDPKAKLKEMMLAYVDGINYHIDEIMEAYNNGDPSLMPIEYYPGVISPSGLPIEYFTIGDCVAIVVMMAWRFGITGGNELNYANALMQLQSIYGNDVGWDIFNDLYPQNDPGAETTIPIEEGAWPDVWHINKKPCFNLPSCIPDVYQKYSEMKTAQKELFESLGLPTKFGSNAFIVSPCKSETGNALEVGGPQMGQSIPQIVLEVGLHGAGINAVGMMMSHAPTILIGASRDGAWTSTTGASDVMDTYIEVLNPDDHSQYWYNGGWVDMEKRTEKFYGFLKQYYEERDIYRTVHGPIIGWDEDNHLCFTIKTPYYKNELAAEEGWSMFQQARNLKDFHEACELVHPNHNFFWVDKKGNIGYWHSGTFPIKPETGLYGRPIDDRFPLWGTGQEEWVGVTGPEDMPICINPDQGWLSNWNNKPIANWPYGESDRGWGEGHRVKRIMDLLSSIDDITWEDMNEINKDLGYNHIPGMDLLDDLIGAASESSDPDIQAALPYLEDWDHHYNDYVDPQWHAPDATYDDPGLTIFDEWYRRIDNAVFDDDLPVGVRADLSTLIHVFDGPNSKLPLNYDYLNSLDKNTVINQVLKEAIVFLEGEYGSDMSKWLTPVRIWVPSAIGALPPPIMHYMNRGTYNQIVEMPKWKNGYITTKRFPYAYNVIPPGQSGFIAFDKEGNIIINPHAYDQLELYETWTYKPMKYLFKDIWEVKESLITLYY
ncbi:MAG: penicillin acylase family protein [Candidatus Thorarchaeota archaeon]